jgi:hypothetical protein
MREGWWDIMANNLKNQTYKIKEWIIVDSQIERRPEKV